MALLLTVRLERHQRGGVQWKSFLVAIGSTQLVYLNGEIGPALSVGPLTPLAIIAPPSSKTISIHVKEDVVTVPSSIPMTITIILDALPAALSIVVCSAVAVDTILLLAGVVVRAGVLVLVAAVGEPAVGGEALPCCVGLYHASCCVV